MNVHDVVPKPHLSWAPVKVLVVHRDSHRRYLLRQRFEARGYDVVSCAGPPAVRCPAIRDPGGPPCPLLAETPQIIVVDADTARTLTPVYDRWAPHATLVVDEPAGSGP